MGGLTQDMRKPHTLFHTSNILMEAVQLSHHNRKFTRREQVLIILAPRDIHLSTTISQVTTSRRTTNQETTRRGTVHARPILINIKQWVVAQVYMRMERQTQVRTAERQIGNLHTRITLQTPMKRQVQIHMAIVVNCLASARSMMTIYLFRICAALVRWSLLDEIIRRLHLDQDQVIHGIRHLLLDRTMRGTIRITVSTKLNRSIKPLPLLAFRQDLDQVVPRAIMNEELEALMIMDCRGGIREDIMYLPHMRGEYTHRWRDLFE